MKFFIAATVAAGTLVVLITTVGCIQLSSAFGYAAAVGFIVGTGAGWVRRVV
jgi:hypothetical protein